MEYQSMLDPEVSHNVTCITFTNRPSISLANELLTEDVFNYKTFHLPRVLGEPSFAGALGAVLKVIENHTARNQVEIILVSDGEDQFPYAEMARLCEDELWKKLSAFRAVAIGGQRLGILERMAQWLVKDGQTKGHYYNPGAYTGLLEVFEEMAVNRT